MCHDNEELRKTWRGIDLPVKNWLIWGIWQTLTQAFEELKNLHFNGLLLTKNVWAKKSTEELMTWRIWNIFGHRLKNSDFILESKIGELNQNKNSKQPDRTDAVWKLYFTLEINK